MPYLPLFTATRRARRVVPPQPLVFGYQHPSDLQHPRVLDAKIRPVPDRGFRKAGRLNAVVLQLAARFGGGIGCKWF